MGGGGEGGWVGTETTLTSRCLGVGELAGNGVWSLFSAACLVFVLRGGKGVGILIL